MNEPTLVLGPSKLLSTKLEIYKFDDMDAVKVVAEAAVQYIDERKIVMAAANQLGMAERFIVMNIDPYIMFNPRIVSATFTDMTILEEWSYSFPNLVVKIKRPKMVRLRFEDVNGQTHTRTFENFTARMILRKMDYLDGVIFYNKANKFHRDAALRKWNRYVDRKNKTAH